MKKIENLKFLTKQGMIKEKGSLEESATTIDCIEYVLDVVPQGGFTPKDIRERARIQAVLTQCKGDSIEFEDADYANLKIIVENSRWGVRSEDVFAFISQFK